MHIVSYSGWFSNISEAVWNTRALAVIGVFFEVNLKFAFFKYIFTFDY
jgi:hypothetical protein